MKITFFSVLMAVIFSSILILLLFFLRKRKVFRGYSVTGVILIYFFCAFRMLVPIEFPGVHVVFGGQLYNSITSPMNMSIGIGKGVTLQNLLLILWGGVAFLLLVRYAFLYAGGKKCVKRLSKKRDFEAESMLLKLTGSKKRVPKVMCAYELSSPCCYGVIHKMIFLPPKEYSEHDKGFILLHEYIHLKNNDTLVKGLFNLFSIFFWWNPMVYLWKRDLNQSLEIRCDSCVVQQMSITERADYLSVLLSAYKDETAALNRNRSSIRVAPQLIESHSAALIERFVHISKIKKQWRLRESLITTALAILMLAASYSFILQSKYEAPMDEIESGPGTFEFSDETSYLILNEDGTYCLHTEYADIYISAESAQMMIDEGFLVKD